MKTRKQIIILITLLVAGITQAQDSKLRKYSAGFRVSHLYDLPVYRYDSELSSDMKGLNGKNTGFDLGVDIYGEAQLTPLVGFQAGVRLGGLTGSNNTEYYQNRFQQGFVDMLLILSNLDTERKKGLPLNYFAKLGLGAGSFRAERYLKSDNSLNSVHNRGYWEGRMGAGVQYEFSPSLRFDFQLAYNIAFNDGFDGYDYSTGSDPYWSTGIGVAYTFGNPEDKPMYSVRLLDGSYGGISKAQKAEQEERADSTETYLKSMHRQLEDVSATLELQSALIARQKELLANQSQSIDRHNAKIEKQEMLIAELRSKMGGEEEEPAKAAAKTSPKEEERQLEVSFEEGELSAESRQILSEAFSVEQAEITLKAAGPAGAEKMDVLQSYLVDELGVDANNISRELSDETGNNNQNQSILIIY